MSQLFFRRKMIACSRNDALALATSFIPKAFGSSINLTGSPESALYGFLAFYVTCIVVTWWFYSRRNAEIPC